MPGLSVFSYQLSVRVRLPHYTFVGVELPVGAGLPYEETPKQKPPTTPPRVQIIMGFTVLDTFRRENLHFRWMETAF